MRIQLYALEAMSLECILFLLCFHLQLNLFLDIQKHLWIGVMMV